MRNTVIIVGGTKPTPRFRDLEVGDLFQYPTGDCVYIKSRHDRGRSVDDQAVNLRTGLRYDVGAYKEVIPVRDTVSISPEG